MHAAHVTYPHVQVKFLYVLFSYREYSYEIYEIFYPMKISCYTISITDKPGDVWLALESAGTTCTGGAVDIWLEEKVDCVEAAVGGAGSCLSFIEVVTRGRSFLVSRHKS